MTYKEIVQKVSENTGIPVDIVNKAYRYYWLYIRTSIQSLPLKEGMTEEEFSQLRPNFNIPSIGKLTCTYGRYIGMKERFKHIKKIREKQ